MPVPKRKPGQFDTGPAHEFVRGELDRAFNDLNLRRDTAVVVVGWTYQDEVLDKLVADWKSVLKDSGFRRFVCLRGGYGGNIRGLQVLDDSNLSVGETKQAAKL